MYGAGGRKRVRSTRSATSVPDGSDVAVSSSEAVAEAVIEPTADAAFGAVTGEAVVAHASPDSAQPTAATQAAGAFAASDDGNGRGKRTKTRRGGASIDAVKADHSANTNGHAANAALAAADDPSGAASTAPHTTAPAPVSTSADAAAAALMPVTRSPSSPPSTSASASPTSPPPARSHQVIHDAPPDSRSVPPTPPLNVDRVIPGHPVFPSSSRGYVAYFYWRHYPLFVPANAPPPVRRPVHTELVPSIPTIFYKVMGVLSDSEYNLYGYEALSLMDKKLYKPTAPPPAPEQQHSPPHHVLHRHVLLHPSDVPVDELDATKLLLRDHAGGEYVVTACRKEHVRLLYDTDASVLGRLGICPLFLDVYSVQGGKKALVGGAGNERRMKGGGDGWVCTCREGAVPLVKKEEGAPVQPAQHKGNNAHKQESSARADVKEEAAMDDATADESVEEQKDERMLVEGNLQHEQRAEADAPVVRDDPEDLDYDEDHANDEFHRMQRAEPAATKQHELGIKPLPSWSALTGEREEAHSGDALDDDLLPLNDALTPVSSTPGAHSSADAQFALTPTSSSAVSSYHPPAHINTAFAVSSLSDAEREKAKRKLSALQRQLSSVSDQLKSVTTMSNMWEAKYKEEKDVNSKLWARIVQVQRQLRQMSRPLTTALASQGRL